MHPAQRSANALRVLSTTQAADLLALRPQTLRRWACYGCGPIRPVKIGGGLRWRYEDLQSLTHVPESAAGKRSSEARDRSQT